MQNRGSSASLIELALIIVLIAIIVMAILLRLNFSAGATLAFLTTA